MALAIDGSTPVAVLQTVNTTTTVTTASFTPPAGSLLLVIWQGNTGSGINPGTPTVTDNLGTHLTYTLTDWQSHANAPAVSGQVACWWAVVGTSAAMTVTVTTGTASGNTQAVLQVVVITGQHATPIGAHGKSGSASAASIAQTYVAQATAGWGFIGVCDWAALGTQTAGTGCTVISAGSIAGQISYGNLRRTSADDANGVSNTLNVTVPGTSTDLTWVYVEVVPAAGAAAAFPPYWEGRRRLVAAPRVPRARTATPVRAQLNPPMPFVDASQPRRVRGLAARRGRAWQPIPPQVVVPPPPSIPSTVRARLKVGRIWRGHMAAPIPAQVIVTPPAYPSQPIRIRLKAAPTRRRDPAVPPLEQDVPAPTARARTKPPTPRRRALQANPPDQMGILAAVRERLRPPRPPRGHLAQPAPAQIIVAPPLWTPVAVRARLKFGRLFRAHTAAVVPPQIVVTPPATVPSAVRIRTRPGAQRRGHVAQPVPVQAVVPPPAYPLQSVRMRVKGARRGASRVATPTPAQVVPVPANPRTRLKGQRRAGQRTAMPIPAQVVTPPAAYTPGKVRQAITRLIRAARGKARPVVPPQGTPPLFVGPAAFAGADSGVAFQPAESAASLTTADAATGSVSFAPGEAGTTFVSADGGTELRGSG